MTAPRTASVSGARRGWLRPALLLLALPLVPAVMTGWIHPRRPGWTTLRNDSRIPASPQLEPSEVSAKHPDALWIDARSSADFASGHVPSAIHLNEDNWDAGFAVVAEQWDGARPIVVYCGGESCHASEAVARRLRRELGSENIHVLRGGWPAWQAAQSRNNGQ